MRAVVIQTGLLLLRARDGRGAEYDHADATALLGFAGGQSLGWNEQVTPCGESPDCHGGRYSSVDCPGGWSGVKSCTGGRVRVVRLSRVRSVSGDITRLCGDQTALAALTTLELASTSATGDVGALAGCRQLTFIDLHSSQVTGRIDRLAELAELTYINLSGTRVEGDVGLLASLTGLYYLHLASTLVGGDVGRLAGLQQLTDLHLDGCSNVYGDAAALVVASGEHEHFYRDSCRPRADCDETWEVCGHACTCGTPVGGEHAVGRSDAACCTCEMVEHGSCASPVAGGGECSCDIGYSGERCEQRSEDRIDSGRAPDQSYSCTLEELGRLTDTSCPRASPGQAVPASCPAAARTPTVAITHTISLIHTGTCETTSGCAPIDDEHVCGWIGTVAHNLTFQAGSGHLEVGPAQQMTTPAGCVHKGNSRLKFNPVESLVECGSSDSCFCLGSCAPVDTACEDDAAFLVGGSRDCAVIASYPASSRQAACDAFVDDRTGTAAAVACPVACGTGCAEGANHAPGVMLQANCPCFQMSKMSDCYHCAGCANVFTAWWRSCQASEAVALLGRVVGSQLVDFNAMCAAELLLFQAHTGAGAQGSGH